MYSCKIYVYVFASVQDRRTASMAGYGDPGLLREMINESKEIVGFPGHGGRLGGVTGKR